MNLNISLKTTKEIDEAVLDFIWFSLDMFYYILIICLVKIGNSKINNLANGDGLEIMIENHLELQAVIRKIQRVFVCVNLVFTLKKSKEIVFRECSKQLATHEIPSSPTSPPQIPSIKNTPWYSTRSFLSIHQDNPFLPSDQLPNPHIIKSTFNPPIFLG